MQYFLNYKLEKGGTGYCYVSLLFDNAVYMYYSTAVKQSSMNSTTWYISN